MKLAAMVQVYNEVESGNLFRCLSSLERYCDVIQIYDDGSIDNPGDLYQKFNCDVIWGLSNDFQNELEHKQVQLERCKELGADWVWRIDADEVIEYIGEKGALRELCQAKMYDSWAFHMVNLWRHPRFFRLDNSYNDVVFNRLWRLTPDLHFNVEHGLHKTNYPVGVTDNEGFASLEVIHYGFASDEAILAKYQMYKENGQSGWALNRLVDESSLKVANSTLRWFKDVPPKVSPNEIFKYPIARLVK